MTEEEYYRQQQELERLLNEYNRLVSYHNRLVDRHNDLVRELEISLAATVEAINYASKVQQYVVPRLGVSMESVSAVAGEVKNVQAEIELLSQKYFTVKNISTASKKMTQLNDEYQRNFGLYNMLRRVALGYVVGVDKSIISNEKLRVTVEKNYLQNADYWISHALMATMLWVSDEVEAAGRAVAKAMEIDPHKSSLYFLLINLHFGRSEAAGKWFEYYIQDIDVQNVGAEIRILLQAYLYNICGNDEEFRNKIRDEFNDLLSSVKSQKYDATIKRHVLEFISSYAHKTTEEFLELQITCKDYRSLIESLECAEKNRLFAKYFTDLYESDSDSPKDLIVRIQNVLYDLINTYDEAEMAILRSMDYNDMILQARGDLAAAQKMYNNKYQPERPTSLGDLLIRLALPNNSEEIDIRVRKFAVSFLCDGIKKAFEAFKEQYSALPKTKHEVIIDSFDVTVDEENYPRAEVDLRNKYKKNRGQLIRKDKGVKIFTGLTVVFWILWAASIAFAAVTYFKTDAWSGWAIGLFVATFVLAVLFTILLILRRKKVGEYIQEAMEQSVKKLLQIQEAIKSWRELFTVADSEITRVYEALDRFMQSEEVQQ